MKLDRNGPRNLGSAIASLRTRAGMDRVALGKAVNRSPDRLRGVEAGWGDVTLSELLAISAALGQVLIINFRPAAAKERSQWQTQGERPTQGCGTE